MSADPEVDEKNGDLAASFNVSEDLIESRQQKQASTSRIDFNGLLAETPLALHEDLSNGNGGQAWPAGRVLATYLLRMKREELKSKSIVELGAGGGLVGLALAIGCKPTSTLYITDQDSMLTLMKSNVALNNLDSMVQPVVYDWGSQHPEQLPAHPDVVLAADCVYFEPAFPLLLQTLQTLLGPHTICYFCFKKRRRADMHFMKAAKKLFEIREITDDPDHAQYAKENIHLYAIIFFLQMCAMKLTTFISCEFWRKPNK